MTYSDKQLQLATEIAYFDFHRVPERTKGFKNVTVIEAIDILLENEDFLSNQDIKRLKLLQQELMEFGCDKWMIVDSRNDNKENQSGFYGVVIDTGDGHIVSLRGSENIFDSQHTIQDWKNADLALMNNTLTDQQKVLNEWLKEINESDYIKNYDTIAFTGHSLGGNLATHASIMSTYHENIFSRLKQSVNFDGPGFSREYFEEYQSQIDQVRQLLAGDFRHYQWSVVGALLEPVPGINFMTVATKKEEGFLKRIGDYFIMEHSTENLDFDSNGYVKEGNMSIYEIVVGKFSEYVDRLPAIVGNLLVDILGAVLIVATWDNEHFRTAVIGAAVVFVIATLVTGTFPVVLAVIGRLIVGIVTILVAGATREMILELIENISIEVANMLSKTYQWTKSQLTKLIDFIQAEITNMKNWFNNLKKSLGYAVATPFIEVNTHKLRQYAERLERVRRRIRNLDREMNTLYFTKGYLDLLSIIRANRLPSSWQIKRCIDYLEDTADAFENAERKILSQV